MNKRILLADDSLTIQKVVELTFMDESFDVEAVGSGDEALASLESSPPDVLIADVHMPGPSGYEVCRRAKELRADLPVLLLVGTFESLDENEIVACGADGNLKKPFDSQELLHMVQEMASRTGSAVAAPDEAGAVSEGAAEEGVDDAPLAEGFEATSFDAASEAEVASPGSSAGFEMVSPAPDEEDAGEDDAAEADVEAAVDEAVEPAVQSAETVELGFSGDSEDVAPEIDEALDEAPEEPVGSPDAGPMDALLGALDDAESPSEPPPAIAAIEEPEEDAQEPADAALSAQAPSESTSDGMSEADVERVARRVVEMIGEDTVREVAWEVIPDLAEIVIKDRIRELEAEAD